MIDTKCDEYIETWQELRPNTATRIQRHYEEFMRQVNLDNVPSVEEANMGIGSTTYEKRDGKWYRLRRTKNPAYWDQPQYFFIAPGPGNMAFIVVKQPRRITTKVWRKACSQIYKEATGKSFYNREDRPIVDGSDKEIFDRRVSGKKPEPAYEIFIDGTWKCLKR